MNFKAFVAVFTVLSFPALASKFAVVDMKKIEDEAIVTKNLKAELTKAGKELQEELSAAQEKVTTKVEELQKASTTLSSDVLEKRRAALQKEFAAIDTDLKEKDIALQQARDEALNEINEKVKAISTSIAEKEGYDLVFTSAVLISYSKNTDITQEVIKRLNKEMKRATFKIKKKNN